MQFSKKKISIKIRWKINSPCTKNRNIQFFTLGPLVRKQVGLQYHKQVGLQYHKSLIMYGYCAYPAMSISSFKNDRFYWKDQKQAKFYWKDQKQAKFYWKDQKQAKFYWKDQKQAKFYWKDQKQAKFYWKDQKQASFLSFSYTSLYINQEPGD